MEDFGRNPQIAFSDSSSRFVTVVICTILLGVPVGFLLGQLIFSSSPGDEWGRSNKGLNNLVQAPILFKLSCRASFEIYEMVARAPFWKHLSLFDNTLNFFIQFLNIMRNSLVKTCFFPFGSFTLLLCKNWHAPRFVLMWDTEMKTRS